MRLKGEVRMFCCFFLQYFSVGDLGASVGSGRFNFILGGDFQEFVEFLFRSLRGLYYLESRWRNHQKVA